MDSIKPEQCAHRCTCMSAQTHMFSLDINRIKNEAEKTVFIIILTSFWFSLIGNSSLSDSAKRSELSPKNQVIWLSLISFSAQSAFIPFFQFISVLCPFFHFSSLLTHPPPLQTQTPLSPPISLPGGQQGGLKSNWQLAGRELTQGLLKAALIDNCK